MKKTIIILYSLIFLFRCASPHNLIYSAAHDLDVNNVKKGNLLKIYTKSGGEYKLLFTQFDGNTIYGFKRSSRGRINTHIGMNKVSKVEVVKRQLGLREIPPKLVYTLPVPLNIQQLKKGDHLIIYTKSGVEDRLTFTSVDKTNNIISGTYRRGMETIPTNIEINKIAKIETFKPRVVATVLLVMVLALALISLVSFNPDCFPLC